MNKVGVLGCSSRRFSGFELLVLATLVVMSCGCSAVSVAPPPPTIVPPSVPPQSVPPSEPSTAPTTSPSVEPLSPTTGTGRLPEGRILVANMSWVIGEAYDPTDLNADVEVKVFFHGINVEATCLITRDQGTGVPGVTVPGHVFRCETYPIDRRVGNRVTVRATTADGRSAIIGTTTLTQD